MVERGNPRRGVRDAGVARRALLGAALAAGALLTFGVPIASAQYAGHVFSASLTFKGSGAAELGTPQSVDVDDSNGPSKGDIYVTDSANHRVEKFDATGNFILMFGDEVNATTTGDVCTQASGNTCKAGNSGSSAQQLTTPNWLAVDQTSGLSRGDVYVVDTNNNSVHKYDENGNLITSWGSGGELTGIDPGTGTESFGTIIGIDVDAAGNLDVANTNAPPRIWRIAQDGTFSSIHPFGGGRGTSANGFAVSPDDHVFKANGSPGVQRSNAAGTQPVEISQSFGQTTGIAVDPTSGTLYQANAGTQVAEYLFNGAGVPLNAEGQPCPQTLSDGGPGCEPTHFFGSTGPSLSEAKGIGVNSATNTVYVADSGNHRVAAFVPAFAPIVTTGEPTANRTVSGEVKLDGAGNVTECYFEWGAESPAYGNTASCEAGEALPYTHDLQVTATIPSLVADQTYHYRLVAKSTGGGTAVGKDETITPTNVHGLRTLAATSVTRTTATLNASYEGNNEATHWYFGYGLTTEPYEHTTVPPPGALEGPTLGLTSLSAGLSGLTPGTTYRFKVFAENGAGPSKGKELTFTTPPAVTGLSTDPATNVLPESVDLNGSFTGDSLDTNYFFEWGGTTLYGNTTPEGEITAPSGPITLPAPHITGLQPFHTYHYRVVAKNIFGTTYGADETFITTTPPVVVTESSAHVTGTTADLRAVINPHGVEAEYHFEYGPTTQYGSSAPVPDEVITATESNVPVEVHITGLNGGTYHFRVVATSKYGTTRSEDQSFNFYPPVCPNSTVRQQTGANTLPDCRAYELVTPEDQGITFVIPATVPFSATATSPSRLDFAGEFGSIGGVGDPINDVGDNYVATRTNQGWKTKYVGLPASKGLLGGGPPWLLPTVFEADKWLTEERSNPSLSEVVQWNDGHPEGAEGQEEPGHPEASNAPYIWNSNNGEQADRWPTNLGAIPDGESFEGQTEVSADMNHFIFTSNIPFAPSGIPGDMYDNDTVARTVRVASVRDNGTHILGSEPADVSADGSHILMTVGGARIRGEQPAETSYFMHTTGPGELYMRVDGAVTYPIAAGHAVEYVGMTPDGKKVYFTSAEDLTENHSDTDTSTDLYMWSETSPAPNHLTLISKGNDASAGNTDSCNPAPRAFEVNQIVQHRPWTTKCGVVPISFQNVERPENGTAVLSRGYSIAQAGVGGSPYSDNFIAPDSGDIYFLSPEKLDGSNGVAGWENLYDYRGEKLQFVAALDPSSEACTSQQSTYCASTAVARIETNADDSVMAFLTGSKVTGYENAGHSEMYRYKPASDTLTCVSCIPSGAAPSGDVTTSHNGRFITEDGRTFFETPDALVAQDTNRAKDVYEYVDGRPQLITSGTNVGSTTFGIATIVGAPGLIGVSANGTDVYFGTYDVLVGQDRNGEALKIYDARSGGGFQFTPPVPPCVAADECHGPSSEEPGPAPSATEAALGSDNLSPSAGKRAGKRSKHRKHRQKQRHEKHRRESGRPGARSGRGAGK